MKGAWRVEAPPRAAVALGVAALVAGLLLYGVVRLMLVLWPPSTEPPDDAFDVALARWQNLSAQGLAWPLYCESETSCAMLETLRQATADTVGRGLCFFTINDQRPRYMGFVPLYAYFILAAYPEARVVVVSSHGFPEEVREAVRIVQRELGAPAPSVQLVFDADATLEYEFAGKSNLVAALRFLYDDPEGALDGCTFVYVGDVDILVERERDSVLAFHARRMLASGQPFDNARRYLSPSGPCNDTSGDRLTGLHMVLYPVYRNRTAAARREMRALVNSGTVDTWCCARGDFCDEHILYKVVRRAGLDPGPRLPSPDQITLHRARPRHGVHFSHDPDWDLTGNGTRPDGMARRAYYCPHLETLVRILPFMASHPRYFVEALLNINCRRPAGAP